mmetsp:Transcript_19427/g.49801  ORF Transcript_19427/g.49801 Transcript_19427/m.49801 type:complete len:310 (-) Transcript_19427:448-1377(-)
MVASQKGGDGAIAAVARSLQEAATELRFASSVTAATSKDCMQRAKKLRKVTGEVVVGAEEVKKEVELRRKRAVTTLLDEAKQAIKDREMEVVALEEETEKEEALFEESVSEVVRRLAPELAEEKDKQSGFLHDEERALEEAEALVKEARSLESEAEAEVREELEAMRAGTDEILDSLTSIQKVAAQLKEGGTKTADKGVIEKEVNHLPSVKAELEARRDEVRKEMNESSEGNEEDASNAEGVIAAEKKLELCLRCLVQAGQIKEKAAEIASSAVALIRDKRMKCEGALKKAVEETGGSEEDWAAVRKLL